MIKKVLILRFSSIGDIVLTTPVIRAIKQQLNIEVHYLTKANFAQLLASNPHIDKLHTFQKSTDEVLKQLKSEKFDFILDLHKNARTFKLKMRLGVSTSSFPKLNLQKWIYVNTKRDVMPNIHVVDRYFEAVKKIGVQNDGLGLEFYIPEFEQIDIVKYLPVNFHVGFAVYTLGAQYKTKCLPLEKMTELVHKNRQPLVLLGGDEDADLGYKLQALNPNLVLNLAGKLSLLQSASVVQQSRVVIAHDTGLMHIAAAFRRPIAVLWGNTTPKIGMYPYGNSASQKFFEVENLNCRPCSKIGYQSCPKKHFNCMQQQNIDELVNFVSSFFG
jgi:heptosyltransferase-2